MTLEAINYLKCCFSFAVKQHGDDPVKVAEAIRAIPLYANNNHDECRGSWCRYDAEKENYDHNRIPGGFKDESSRGSLIYLLDSISASSGKYSHGASTQLNENFHHVPTKLVMLK